MQDITVIVAGANPAMRNRLVVAIGASPGLRLIAQASDLPATYTASEALEPDIVLVARDLTLLPEFTLMRSLFRALRARWIPVDHRGHGSPRIASIAAPQGDPAPIDSAWTAEVMRDHLLQAMRHCDPGPPLAQSRMQRAPSDPRSGKLILLGASTGGVDALLSVLSELPPDCPPVAVVQHTGKGFTESLIRLLDRRCAVTVEAAQSGMELRSGRVCVAAGCPGHMRLSTQNPFRVTVEPGPLIAGHLPSVDALFHSAVPAATHVVAALLTGMGRDGAEGLLALRAAGAMTIGQDERSSIVYGMPRAAWEIGAVRQQLPLDDIAGAILRACAQGPDEGRIAS